MEPIVAGLYARGPAAAPSYDDVTLPALERYVAASREGDTVILATIESFVRSREAILVWGAGSLARRLLATTELAKANIVAFVDSNPHLTGRSLAGRPILGPEQIAGRKEPILICSYAFEKEIAEVIRKRYRLANRIMSFTGTNPR